MEIRARGLRIILIFLAVAMLVGRPDTKPVDVDMLILILTSAALVLPPIIQMYIQGKRLNLFDILQISGQIIGPVAIWTAAAIDGPHGIFVPAAVLFYGLIIIAVILWDIAAVVVDLRSPQP